MPLDSFSGVLIDNIALTAQMNHMKRLRPATVASGLVSLRGIVIAFTLLCECVCADSDGFGAGARYRDGGSFAGSNPVLGCDGSRLVFAAPYENDDGEIFSLDLNSAATTRLIQMRGYQGQPSLSSDMKKLAFVDESSGMPAIWLADGKNKTVGRLTKSQFAEALPVVSPDGMHVAFVRRLTQDPNDRKHNEIFVIDADGKNERRLTANNALDVPLRFSLDNRSLYIITHEMASTKAAARYRLFSIDLKDNRASTFLEGGEIADPALSADGKTLAYAGRVVDFDYDIFLQQLSGGPPRRLTHLSNSVGSIDFGCESDTFTYVVDPDRSGLGNVFMYDIKTNKSKYIGTTKVAKVKIK